MTKFILTTAIVCLYSISSFAQSFTVSGQLQNTESEGIPYASISLSKRVDTATIQFAIAKEDGTYFMKNVAAGDYYLVVACIGYDVAYKAISVSQDLV